MAKTKNKKNTEASKTKDRVPSQKAGVKKSDRSTESIAKRGEPECVLPWSFPSEEKN